MARDSLNAEIARQRQAELRRAAERHSVRAEVLARPDVVRATQLLGESGRRRVLLRALVQLSRRLVTR